MSQLTKQIKETILNKALEKAGVFRREEALIERRAKLAEDVRLFAIGGKSVEEEVIAKMKKIETYIKKNSHDLILFNWLGMKGKDDEVYANFAGRSVNLSFNGQRDRCGKIVYKYLVTSRPSNRVAITPENPLNDEFDAIELEQKTIDDLRLQIKLEANAILNSVTTIKKLIEVWPECKELIPEDEQSQSTALVANVSKLNTMIGLPSEE